MKGIILAAGKGTRLSPATLPISKILLPIYDRPMVYYPLTTLINAGIRDILIITNESDLKNFQRTLGDGTQFGVNITYTIQYVQRGIADAFLIAEDFIKDDKVCLILGDNIFYGPHVDTLISDIDNELDGAVVFGIPVRDPERFGVLEFDNNMNIISIEEKPKDPKSNYVAVGLYFYDANVCSLTKTLKPSARGELEITDLNNLYLEKKKLKGKLFEDGTRWIDAGTFDSFLEASEFVCDEEKSLGRKIMCPEIAAFKKGYISKKDLEKWLDKNKDNEYFKGVRSELLN